MTFEMNWEMLKQEAFTAIRMNFTIDTLIQIEADSGNYTPVSGDSITTHTKGKR